MVATYVDPNNPMPSTATMAPDTNRDSSQTQVTDQPQAGAPASSPVGAGNPQAGPPRTDGTPQPTQPQATPAGQPQRPHPVANAFNGILKSLSGGPIMVTNPDGSRREVPQTKSQLSRSILAGALAGLFTPNVYTPTPYGQRLDIGASAAAAGQTGMNMVKERDAQAQKQSDDQETHRLMNLQNASALATQMAASAHAKHAQLDDIIKDNATFRKPFDDLKETGVNPYQNENMTADEVLASGHKLTDNGVFVDGQRSVPDANGNMEPHPTYAIVNSGVDLTLPSEVTDLLGKYSVPYSQASKMTNGNTRVSAVAYLAAMQQYHTINTVEHSLNMIQKAVDPKATPVDLAAAYKKNPAMFQTAVKNAAQVIASGMGGQDKDAGEWFHLSKSLATVPNGSALLDLIKPAGKGNLADMTESEITKEIKEREKNPNPASAPADPAKIDAAKKVIDQIKDPTVRDSMAAKLVGTPTNAEVDKIDSDARDQWNKDKDRETTPPTAAPANFKLPDSAPEMESDELRKSLTTQGVELPKDFDALYATAHNASDLKSFPASPRKGTNQRSATDALNFIRKYINPLYNEGDYAASQVLNKEIASTKNGTAGGSLLNAGVASQHLELLAQAADDLKNGNVVALNNIAQRLKTAVGKSPANTFMAIADQANGEVGKVVAGGVAHEAELNALRARLNQDQSPEQTADVIKAYVGLMSGRLGDINDRYKQYFGRDVKGVSPDTARVFAKYGLTPPTYSKVTIPGYPAQLVPNSQLRKLREKYPNAQIGQ